MSKVLVTSELFDNMDFDTPTNILKDHSSVATSADNGNKQPSLLVVFSNSDINAALYHLIKSLNSPFAPQAIATVLVQESIKQDFVEKLTQQFKTYTPHQLNRNENFTKALETCRKLNANIITVGNREENVYQPTLVYDFTHEHLGASPPSGIVTFHTFRTAKEAITLVNKESLKFSNVSIWHENHSCAYELVAALKFNNFFINCHQVSFNILEESITQRCNNVIMDNSYHYETLLHDSVQKSIAFPIGSIFAN